MAEIKLTNVGKSFRNEGKGGWIAAVSNVSLDVADHEFITIIGPSESGKSSLLKLIVGLEDADSGEIRIDGAPIKTSGRNRVRTGMVFRNGSLYPHMNVYRNLAFPLRLQHIPKEETERRIQDTARLLHAEDLLQKKPKELSREQKLRIAIARAIVGKPDVVVMDEPLVMLDDQERGRLRTELLRLRERRELTVIYAAYDLPEAMALGDRVVSLQDGRIEWVRTPEDILKEQLEKKSTEVQSEA